jgi:hypothetical protein
VPEQSALFRLGVVRVKVLLSHDAGVSFLPGRQFQQEASITICAALQSPERVA